MEMINGKSNEGFVTLTQSKEVCDSHYKPKK
jgi:hypothetical protein